MVLFDFSKTYDTVWKQPLLFSMVDMGVPMPLVRWLNSFLQNHRAQVQFNGATSDCRPMHQGLPQESVLAPLLFIFYINSLADILPSNNLNCMFADDVGIVATACDRNEAVASAQAGVDFVAEHLLGVTLDGLLLKCMYLKLARLQQNHAACFQP